MPSTTSWQASRKIQTPKPFRSPLGLLIGILFCGGVLLNACAHAPSPLAPSVPETDLFSLAVAFYGGPLNHLSAVRGGECPMVPSDSAYSRLAVRKHGPLVGWVMAMDRLMRCGRDETRLSPPVWVNGQWKTLDPPEANDVWWSLP